MAKPRITIGTNSNEVTIETPALTPAPVEKKSKPKAKATRKAKAEATITAKTPLEISNEIANELPPMPVEEEYDGVAVESVAEDTPIVADNAPGIGDIVSGLSDEDRQEIVRLLYEAVDMIDKVRQELLSR